MPKYVIGDIHGRADELISLLSNIGFDYENDTLISVGDLVDRGSKPFEVIFELMKIKNLISVQGNHDCYLLYFVERDGNYHPLDGFSGSQITIEQWLQLHDDYKLIVKDFLLKQKKYHIDEQNNLFVHAGIETQYKIDEQIYATYIEDREFFSKMLSMQDQPKDKKIKTIEGFNEIYIGHTPTLCFSLNKKGILKKDDNFSDRNILTPINICNVWNMDTGAGFVQGRLSIMNIDTKELFQVAINKI